MEGKGLIPPTAFWWCTMYRHFCFNIIYSIWC